MNLSLQRKKTKYSIEYNSFIDYVLFLSYGKLRLKLLKKNTDSVTPQELTFKLKLWANDYSLLTGL